MSRQVFRRTMPLLAILAFFLAIPFRLSAAGEEKKSIRSIADLNGKRLGVIAGTMLDEAANATLDYTQKVYFDDNQAEIAALLSGVVDAVVDDEPVVRFLVAGNPRLRQLPENMQYDDYGYAVRQDDDELLSKMNSAMADLREEGVIDELVEKWVSGTSGERKLPQPAERPEAPLLRLGASPVSAPFVYHDDNRELTGFDVELLMRIADRMGYRLTLVDLEFSNLIPSLTSGRVDVIASCLSITEERSKVVTFTDSYYRGGVAAMVLADP